MQDVDKQTCGHCGANVSQNQGHDQGCPERGMPSDRMHRYRWYSNINWGPCYDPETKAHYASASDVETLCSTYPNIEAASLQVHLGDGYHWVTETPEHLGGISHNWHGELI